MIDFHNHILPNVDDGSKSMDMSLSMFECAFNQGITDVVNTVHYQHPKVEDKTITFEIINEKISEMQNVLYENDILINLHIGSEVFYLPNLLDLLNDPLATIGDMKYMLIEFHPENIPLSHKKQFFDLKMKGVTPIIAHPERYRQVQNNINLVPEWLESGCLVQVDAGSPLGLLGKRAQMISMEIIKNNWCQIVGSDAHDNKVRNFCLKDSIDLINNFTGEDKSYLVEENPKKILNGEIIHVDIDYPDSIKKTNIFYDLKRKMGWEKKK